MFNLFFLGLCTRSETVLRTPVARGHISSTPSDRRLRLNVSDVPPAPVFTFSCLKRSKRPPVAAIRHAVVSSHRENRPRGRTANVPTDHPRYARQLCAVQFSTSRPIRIWSRGRTTNVSRDRLSQHPRTSSRPTSQTFRATTRHGDCARPLVRPAPVFTFYIKRPERPCDATPRHARRLVPLAADFADVSF